MEFDEILTSALCRAAELDYGEISSDDDLLMATPSPHFQRKMQALLSNPSRYIRNRRRPVYLNVLRGTVAAVIAFVLLLGAVMAVSPTVRAAVASFVRSWFEDRAVYTPIGDDLIGEWIFGYIPDGFEQEHEMITDYQIFRVYSDNERLLFVTISASAITLDNEHHEQFETVINGHFASIYHEITGEHPNKIIIFFETHGVFVLLLSELSVEELIRIAENIKY